MKTLITTAVILAATSSAALAGSTHDKFTCDRTNLSTTGFVDREAADSWFPKKAIVTVADDKSWMHSRWGTKYQRSMNERKHNAATFAKGGNVIAVRISDDNKMTANFVGKTGFKHTNPSYYTCVKTTTSLAPSKTYQYVEPR